MAVLTKEQILASNDLMTESVNVPEWGGVVLVRCMTGAERDEYEQGIVAERGKSKQANLKNIRASLLAYTIVSEHGQRLFDKSDIEALGNKSIKAIQRVFDVASKLNALSDDDVEELAGNSEAAQNGDSTTDGRPSAEEH